MKNRHFVLRSVPPQQQVIAEGDAPTFRRFIEDELAKNPNVLRGADLRKRPLSGLAIPRGADCTGADLSGAKLNYINAPEVIFDLCRFNSTKMRSSLLRRCSIKLATFHYADMTAADVGNGDLRNSIFDHCDMAGINAREASFDSCTINSSDLTRAMLIRASFNDGVVVRSDFRGAQIVPSHPLRTKHEAKKDTDALYSHLSCSQNTYGRDTSVPRDGAFYRDNFVFRVMAKAIYVPSLLAGMYIDSKVQDLHAIPWFQHELGLATVHSGASGILVAGTVTVVALGLRIFETAVEDKTREIISSVTEKVRSAAGRFMRAVSKPGKLAYLIANRETFGDIDQILRSQMDTWRSSQSEPRRGRRSPDVDWIGDVPVRRVLLHDTEVIVVHSTDVVSLLSRIRAARTHEKFPVIMLSDKPFSPDRASIPASVTFDRHGNTVVRFRDCTEGPDIFAAYDQNGRNLFLARPNGDKRPIPEGIVEKVKLGMWAQVESFITDNCEDYVPQTPLSDARPLRHPSVATGPAMIT